MKKYNVSKVVAGAGLTVSTVTCNVPGVIASLATMAASSIIDEQHEKYLSKHHNSSPNDGSKTWAEASAMGDPCMWD